MICLHHLPYYFQRHKRSLRRVAPELSSFPFTFFRFQVPSPESFEKWKVAWKEEEELFLRNPDARRSEMTLAKFLNHDKVRRGRRRQNKIACDLDIWERRLNQTVRQQ